MSAPSPPEPSSPSEPPRRSDRVAGRDDRPVLPSGRDADRDEAWGDRPRSSDRDAEWYRRQRPPHYE